MKGNLRLAIEDDPERMLFLPFTILFSGTTLANKVDDN